MSHSGAQKDFTHQLSLDLQREGHFPFFDQWSDCLPKGEGFANLILKAAEQCSMAVVVLSSEYMSSKWPMIELNTFYKAQSSTRPELIVFPVFYKLQPGDLSDKSKLHAWEEEWKKHQEEDIPGRIDIESWRRAVQKLRGTNGLDFAGFGKSEVLYRARLVTEICTKLPPSLGYDLSGIQGCNRLCEILEGMFEPTKGNAQGLQILGLYGMGGVGKTTMCKALCNHFQSRFQGRVCHVELGPREKYLDLQKKVLKKLTNLGNVALQDITDSDEAQLQMERRMGGQDVFLAVDNVEDVEDSREQARAFLKCTFSGGSKLLVTGRSSIVVRIVLGRDEDYCKPVPNVDATEALSIFLEKAAPRRSISLLSEEEKYVVEECAQQACFSGKYHPLALRVLASYYNDVDDRNPLRWKHHLNDIHKLRPCRESESGTIFQILGLGFGTLTKETKLLFLDVALYMFCGAEFSGVDTIDWLSAMHMEEPSTIRRMLKNLERMTYMNEIGEDFQDITVHDLYKEFANWHVAQSGEEDANKATCIYYDSGTKVPSMLEKGRAGKCWEELSRIYLRGLLKVNILPPHSNEWANVVALNLVCCPDLISLNLQGMERLQHLVVWYCGSLEKLEASVEEECMPRLHYLKLWSNKVLESVPKIWRCAELVHVEISECPKLLLHSMDVEACPKLECLEIDDSCERGLPKVALTQNLQSLTIYGKEGSSEHGVLELHDWQSMHCESVRESGLHEASNSEFELDLNKDPNEARPRKKRKGLQSHVVQYGRNLTKLCLNYLSLRNSKVLENLSGLQQLSLRDVQLMDEGTFRLEGLTNLTMLIIKGGNVHTITGIGELRTLETLGLIDMEALQYLPDIKFPTLFFLDIIRCEKLDGDVREIFGHFRWGSTGYMRRSLEFSLLN